MTPEKPIKFGTDGWRGIIAADFTERNVRLASEAIAGYVCKQEDPARGLCVGYDTRFLSRRFAEIVAETAAAAGIPVRLADRITPTPALSYAVKHLEAAGGVMITSSHNPYNWNGVKYKAFYGGSGSPAIMAAVESYLGKEAPRASSSAAITEADFVSPYVAAISAFADLKRVAARKQKYAIDCMYGAGRGILAGIFSSLGIEHVEIRAELNPLFPGIQPEPIPPHIRALEVAVRNNQCQAGFATDGDADRIGAVDEAGQFVDANKIYCLLLEWLLKRKQWPGDVARAFNTTKMIDRIAARYGRKVHEHGIGFKYVCELMLEKEILIGGEESGSIGIGRHLPERDGLLNSLLLASIMAEEGRTLGSLVEALQQEYGEHHYGRLDLHIPEGTKQSAIQSAAAGVREFARMRVLRKETLDGIKFYFENSSANHDPRAAESWILFRASGTEPLLRIYAESGSREALDALLEAGRKFALGDSG
ncbi:MAG TPA: phosphoglucomutase/phosphomannomutase family protein [Acidobacteriaceae bacterium]|nr:phosphoglucomutase/phosphomannomutase family protein [Acidobacteriaceae bacterium]